jgi:hypothetical protein
MKPRRRGGTRVRGGAGRRLISRLSPAARHEYLRRLRGDERQAVIAAANPRAPEPLAAVMHEVVVHGIVAACTKCDWRGAADEAVSHIFGG